MLFDNYLVTYYNSTPTRVSCEISILYFSDLIRMIFQMFFLNDGYRKFDIEILWKRIKQIYRNSKNGFC